MRIMAKFFLIIQKPQCIEHVIHLHKIIQSLSFNLLMGFGKWLLNGWSHKTQMKSLRSLRTFWRQVWDDEMRGIQKVDQVHVRPGEDGDWIIIRSMS